MLNYPNLREKLIMQGLKVTPQRIAVLDALVRLTNHPTTEQIIEHIKKHHPNIAIGTIYKTLLTFVEKGFIKKVTTEKDVLRYDAIIEHHHHLYFTDSDIIEDYYDNELNAILSDYFSKKQIDGFAIEDIKLQITGKRR
jgi:Fur family peroxide stress response transcriptional regulator